MIPLQSNVKENWRVCFKEKLMQHELGNDPAHDLAHFERVAQTATQLCEAEGGKWEVVLPAAWLHDFVIIAKNDARRSQASKLSAEAAIAYLQSINYPEEFFSEIAHAIEIHSFSAKLEAKTLEAQIVQDSDRLDALGAIGIARCFATAGVMKSSLYEPHDPFGLSRARDDRAFALDHFYVKLFEIVKTLKTAAGRREGEVRLETMNYFIQELGRELGKSPLSDC